MGPKFLIAIMLLLQIPIAFGCVVFQAQYELGPTLGDPEPLDMTLTDNGDQYCSYNGLQNDGTLYSMSCSAGFSATMDPNANDYQGGVNYIPPWGNFEFATEYTPGEPDGNSLGTYDASVYGC